MIGPRNVIWIFWFSSSKLPCIWDVSFSTNILSYFLNVCPLPPRTQKILIETALIYWVISGEFASLKYSLPISEYIFPPIQLGLPYFLSLLFSDFSIWRFCTSFMKCMPMFDIGKLYCKLDIYNLVFICL